MAYQSGKEKFSKDEIIEILKRNVALYKDEEEFVDYIVNLAMYLMDQKLERNEPGAEAAEEQGPAASSPAAPPAAQQPPAQAPQPPPKAPVVNRGPQQGPPPAAAHTGFVRPPRENPEDDVSVGGEIDPMEEFLQSAPPKPFGQQQSPPPAPPPGAPGGQPQEPRGSQRPPSEEERRQRGEGHGGVHQVGARPLVTPQPGEKRQQPPQEKQHPGQRPAGQDQEGDDEDGSFDVIDRGRTRVYQVVRSYGSSTAFEVPCTVCGAMVPAESKRCPTCGHLM